MKLSNDAFLSIPVALSNTSAVLPRLHGCPNNTHVPFLSLWSSVPRMPSHIVCRQSGELRSAPPPVWRPPCLLQASAHIFLQYPQIFYSELQNCTNLILMAIVFMFVCLLLKTQFLEGKIHVCVACAPRSDVSFSSVNPNEYCRLEGQMTRSLRNLIFLLISSEIFRYNCTKRDFIDIKRWVVSCILPNKLLCWWQSRNVAAFQTDVLHSTHGFKIGSYVVLK